MTDVLKSAEASFKKLEGPPKPGVTPSRESIVMEAALKDLQDGRVREATEYLTNPAENFGRKRVEDSFDRVHQPDSVDATGNLTHSKEQNDRKDAAKKELDKLNKLSEVGFDKLSTAEQNVVVEQLGAYLADRDVIQALYPKGFDWNGVQRGLVENMLRNQNIIDQLKSNIMDVAFGTEIDYTKLQGLLTEQQKLTVEETDLQAQKQTTEETLAKVTEDLKEYDQTVELDQNGQAVVKKGKYIVEGDRLKGEIKTKTSKVEQYKNAIKAVRDTEQAIEKGNAPRFPFTVFDPDAGSYRTFATINELKDFTKVPEFAQWHQKRNELQKEVDDAQSTVKLIEDKKPQLETQKSQAEKEVQRLQTELEQKATARETKDNELKTEQENIQNMETALKERMEGLLPGVYTDTWERGKRAYEGKEGEVTQQKDVEAYEALREKLYDRLYDQAKRKFRSNEFEQMVKLLTSSPTGQGVENFGTQQINALLTSLPADSELRPFLQEVLTNPDKLKDFSSRITTDMLNLAAYKEPKLFKKIFTTDEAIFRSLKGDVLPDLILNSMGNTEFQQKAEAIFGKGLNKQTLGERLKGMDWKKILMILVALGILSVGLAVVAK